MKRLLRFVLVGIFVSLLVLLSNSVLKDSEISWLKSFELDAISAATDGSECLEPSWIGCSVGWLEKGYVYDATKGHYVKSVGGTTAQTTTTRATTTSMQTTKAAVGTTSAAVIISTGTPSATTFVSTTLSEPTTTAPDTQSVGGETKATYTKRSRVTRATNVGPDQSNNENRGSSSFDLSFLSGLPLGWIAGILAIVGIMVVEFFIVRAIYRKD